MYFDEYLFNISSMASTSKKYKELSLQEKIELLKYSEGHSERKTADNFGVSKTTVNNIKKMKAELLARSENESSNFSRKRRATDFEEINKLTINWFKKMRGLNARISGPMIQEVALKFAGELNLPEFKASSGWLDSFKKRNEISQKVLCGDSNEIDEGIVQNFREHFSQFSSGFALKDIFNADECGLFYRAMPDRALVIKGDSCKSGKQSKERLTILLAASATGEKLTVMVIGKAHKPRCFKNTVISKLPVIWRANKTSWMTSDLFIEWLQIINNEMRKQKRHILMTIDNCPAHPKIDNLSNITVKFLPANTTSKLQPLDQGIIKNFKAYYRKLLLTNIIARSELNTIQSVSEIASKINVLDAILWIAAAWDKVSIQTISKCFLKAGFKIIDDPTDACDDSIEIIYEEIVLPTITGCDLNNFIECDSDTAVWQSLDLEQVFKSVLDEQNELNDSDPNSDYNDEQVLTVAKESGTQLGPEEVTEMLNKIITNFATEQCPEILVPLYNAKSKLAEMICQKRQSYVQTTLDTFFKK